MDRKGLRLPIVAVMVVLALVAAACGDDVGSGEAGTDSEANGDRIVLGHAAAYSGTEAYLGPAMLSGIELAISEINEAGGVLDKELAIETTDTEGRPETAVSAISNLVDVENVVALIGPTSLEVFSVIDSLQDSEIPTIVIGGSARLDDSVGGETMWRGIPSDTVMGPAMAKLATDEGLTTGVAVFEDQESAQSVKATVISPYEALGGEFLAEIDPAVAQGNYRSEVLSMLEGDPDVAFWQMAPENASTFWQNAIEFPELEGLTVVGTDVLMAEESITAFGPALDRINVLALSPTPEGAAKDDFIAAYNEFHDSEEPEVFSPNTYDATVLYSLAMIAGGSADRQTIVDNMRDVAMAPGTVCSSFEECRDLLEDGEEINYEGAAGSWEFDEGGNVLGAFGIFEYQDGGMEQIGVLQEEDLEEALE
ncbi:MAG: ABC transporter substrate-binding protein [Actinomycetota bacterium]|nr:ABC transporter substrate-binding protein [Actinomycetota bacterium]